MNTGCYSPEASLVSVIITSYNQAHFLRQAIDSVLHQTYSRFECLLIDDGSTDNTRLIAGEYESIRYIRQDHHGLSIARNTGIRESSGDLLLFLDADDCLLPIAIEIGVDELRRHAECVLAAGGYRTIAANGVTLSAVSPQNSGDYYERLLERNFIAVQSAVIYRSRIFHDLGGFNPSLRACEDYDLLLRITRRFPICCHAAIVSEYRQHDANMSRDSALMLRSALRVLQSQWGFAKRNSSYKKAFQTGCRFWRNYYGSQLTKQVRADLLSGARVRTLLRNLIFLAYFYPSGLADLLLRFRAFAKMIVRYAPRPN